VNFYHEDTFREKFDLCWKEKMQKAFGGWVEYDFSSAFNVKHDNNTPRQNCLSSKFFVCCLYYLEFLLEKNPKIIVDIGCGENLFKKLIPNIHGINPTVDLGLADEKDFFDAEFSMGHLNQYESVFSINALHFISLVDFEKRILEFYNIVKLGGRGFISLNISRMLELTDEKDLYQLFGNNVPTSQELTHFVENILSKLSINFLVKDILINDSINEYINGNIRLVFEK
jgi:hypothetical protein